MRITDIDGYILINHTMKKKDFRMKHTIVKNANVTLLKRITVNTVNVKFLNSII